MRRQLDVELSIKDEVDDIVIDLTDDTNREALRISLSNDSQGNYFERRKRISYLTSNALGEYEERGPCMD